MKIAAISTPKLRTAEEGGKRAASWLELFYDLVFVVAVAVLGIRLLEDTSWTGVASYVGYFIALWWLWASFTFYADRYDTDDLVYRLLAVGQMAAIVVIAASLSTGPAGSTVAFALGYTAARAVLIAMYARVGRHVPETRILVTGYLRGFTVGASIWLISAFVPEPWRFYLWALGLAIELATPYIMRREQARVPLDVSHLPERFGLFMILVLGESIAAVIAGLSSLTWQLVSTVTAVLGVVVASSVWWIHFDTLEGFVVRRRPGQRTAWRPTAWIYSHLPLAAAIAATGVGLEHAVVDAVSGHAFPSTDRWLLVGAVAVAFAAMGLNQYATVRPDGLGGHREFSRNRLAAIPFVLLIGLLGGLPSIWIVVLLAVVCAFEVAADVVTKAVIEPAPDDDGLDEAQPPVTSIPRGAHGMTPATTIHRATEAPAQPAPDHLTENEPSAAAADGRGEGLESGDDGEEAAPSDGADRAEMAPNQESSPADDGVEPDPDPDVDAEVPLED